MKPVARSVFDRSRLLPAILVCLFAALAQNASAIPVTTCGTTLTIPGGQYELVGNLNCAIAPGVQIGASGITLDLKGFTIFGPGFGAGVITAAGPSCKAVTEVSIRNGSVAGFGTAIALCAPAAAGGTPMYTRVYSVKLFRNIDGIHLYNSNANTIQQNEIFDNRGVGVRLNNSHDNRLVSNALTSNVSQAFSGGIHVSDSNRNVLELNKLVRNGRFGIFVQNSDKNNLSGNVVLESNVAGTPTTGIVVIGPGSQGNVMRSNTADRNENGISLGCSAGCALVSPEVGGVLGSFLIGNEASNNRVFGIDLSDNTANNTVRFNTGSGNGLFDGHDDQGLPPCGSNIWQNNIGALSTFLILATVMLTAIDLSQSSVLAQNSTSTLDSAPITPAPETSSGDDDSSSSSDDSEELSSDVQEDASSSEEDIDETEDEYAQTSPLRDQIRERITGGLSDLSGSDDSDEQNTPLSEVEGETENAEQTIPLLEQITNNVTGTLSSNGLD